MINFYTDFKNGKFKGDISWSDLQNVEGKNILLVLENEVIQKVTNIKLISEVQNCSVFYTSKDFQIGDLVYIKNNEVELIPIEKPINFPSEWNGSNWICTATSKEKQVFWKQKMIETNNKIKELYELGLNGGSEEQQLKLKLEEYKNNYFNALHEEALEINSKKGE